MWANFESQLIEKNFTTEKVLQTVKRCNGRPPTTNKQIKCKLETATTQSDSSKSGEVTKKYDNA